MKVKHDLATSEDSHPSPVLHKSGKLESKTRRANMSSQSAGKRQSRASDSSVPSHHCDSLIHLEEPSLKNLASPFNHKNEAVC